MDILKTATYEQSEALKLSFGEKQSSRFLVSAKFELIFQTASV